MPQFVRSSLQLFKQNGLTETHFSVFGRKILPIFDKKDKLRHMSVRINKDS